MQINGNLRSPYSLRHIIILFPSYAKVNYNTSHFRQRKWCMLFIWWICIPNTFRLYNIVNYSTLFPCHKWVKFIQTVLYGQNGSYMNGKKHWCKGGAQSQWIEWKKINKKKFLQTDKVQWPRWLVSQCFIRKHLVGVAQGEAAQWVAQYLPIKCHESPALTGLFNFTQQSTYTMWLFMTSNKHNLPNKAKTLRKQTFMDPYGLWITVQCV